VTRKTIWNWEHGKTTPRPSSWQLKQVAEVLRVRPGALVYGEENDGDA
jgi:DNA-binding XRE family transcriptional regulator